MQTKNLARTGAIATLALLALPVLAQSNEVVEVKDINNAPVVMGITMMILLGLMALGANAIPSKRGHQD